MTSDEIVVTFLCTDCRKVKPEDDRAKHHGKPICDDCKDIRNEASEKIRQTRRSLQHA